MESKKNSLARETAEAILVTVSNLSDREVDPSVQAWVTEFIAKPCTSAELYDFLAKIAAVQCDRMVLTNGQRIAIGYISGFVQAVCDVSKFYDRPKSDAAKLIDVCAVERKLKMTDKGK